MGFFWEVFFGSLFNFFEFRLIIVGCFFGKEVLNNFFIVRCLCLDRVD